MIDRIVFYSVVLLLMVGLLAGCTMHVPMKRIPQDRAIISLVNAEKTCTVKTNPDKWWRE